MASLGKFLEKVKTSSGNWQSSQHRHCSGASWGAILDKMKLIAMAGPAPLFFFFWKYLGLNSGPHVGRLALYHFSQSPSPPAPLLPLRCYNINCLCVYLHRIFLWRTHRGELCVIPVH
jgi:hypothetical protein